MEPASVSVSVKDSYYIGLDMTAAVFPPAPAPWPFSLPSSLSPSLSRPLSLPLSHDRSIYLSRSSQDYFTLLSPLYPFPTFFGRSVSHQWRLSFTSSEAHFTSLEAQFHLIGGSVSRHRRLISRVIRDRAVVLSQGPCLFTTLGRRTAGLAGLS